MGRRLFAILLLTSLFVQAGYVLKVQDKPTPAIKTAVKDLVLYLQRRTHGQLTVGGHSDLTIHVGDTELAAALNLTSDKMAEEQWVVMSAGDKLLLNGGGSRGALYAVYHFLEDYCDIHWWNDTEEYVPAASPLNLPVLASSGRPMFPYRDIYVGGYSLLPQFAIRNRLNRNGDMKIPAELGGSFNYGPPYHCHTADKFVPVEEFYDEHPEYFALRDGQRKGGADSQLCITNPDVRNIFLRKLKSYIEQGVKEAQEAGVEAPRIYDISMNDNWNCCQCDVCNAAVEKYGQSGLYLEFANWLGENIKADYPNIYLSILAYFYMDEPPKGGMRAADNVIVKLCDTRTSEASSILAEENKEFKTFLEQWKGFANNLYIWDYAITYTRASSGMPFASEFYYGDLFRQYLANNVTGIFWEHEEPFLSDAWELKMFLECKLMENPFQEVNGLISLFMSKYYGAAAQPLLAYRKLLDAACRKNKGFVSWFPEVKAFNYIDADTRAEAQKLFDEAELAVVSDEILFARVRHLRLGLDRYCASINDPDFGAAALKRIEESWPKWMIYRKDSTDVTSYINELKETVK